MTPSVANLLVMRFFYLLEYLGNQQNGWINTGLQAITRSEGLWAPISVELKGLRLLAPLHCKQVY